MTDLFENVKKRTSKRSDVQQFGPEFIMSDETSEIFNLNKTSIAKHKSFIDKVMEWLSPKTKHTEFQSENGISYAVNGEVSVNEELFWNMVSSVTSRDAKLHHLYSKSINSPSNKYKVRLVEHM
jgi:hypothetical protein